VLAWREARAGRPGNRLTRQVATAVPSRSVVFGAGTDGLWAAPRATPATRTGARADHFPAESDLVDDLTRLAELHEAADLTDEEFATAKRERLADETRS
jgi:hypothetical protein